MPIYEYRCEECGTVFEKFVRSVSAEFKVVCPKCGSENCHKNITLFGTTGSKEASSSASASSCSPSG